ncbi:hypothetical protein [Chryseobacterium sp. G0201]|uniref:hypothetical protein n=1 Tax=Chryseobacterium sp. G0201 TaxID=2487065 RepID=UPI000F710AD9|nr:hypothetical protein [Chryseobacterium sp. G0201]AZA52206.1 hypothetical protein EG348_03880 [Chryseobacterium sp. G0201]
MNNQLFTMIFWILALSCKAPISSLYQGKVSLISAEKTEWFGGRDRVKGMIYTLKLKIKNNKDIIAVKSLKAEGNTISFTQSNSGNMIIVKGNFQSTDQADNFENIPSGSSVENREPSQKLNLKENWIEYAVKGSKKLYKINIPKFISVEPTGDLIPQRQ